MARPSAVPRTVPSRVASGVMIRMYLAPMMTRDSTSRPSGSVPNQCAPDGAWLSASRFCASGLYGANRCPKMAQTTQNSTMLAPTQNVALRSSSRHRAGVARLAAATAAAPVGPRYPPVRSIGATGSTGDAAPGSAGCGTEPLIAVPPMRSRGLSKVSSRSAISVATT